jgi:hypothetical protein
MQYVLLELEPSTVEWNKTVQECRLPTRRRNLSSIKDHLFGPKNFLSKTRLVVNSTFTIIVSNPWNKGVPDQAFGGGVMTSFNDSEILLL